MIPFHKMHGAGNDFVVIDNRSAGLTLEKIIDITPRLCDRKYGVGADGLLVLQESETADYTMIYRNADGSDAGMCGNGGRCIALFSTIKGFPLVHSFNVHDKIYEAAVDGRKVTIKFPINVTPRPLGEHYSYELIQVDAATEHVVTQITESQLTQEDELRKAGLNIRSSRESFPNGTNVNFMCGRSKDQLSLQTYERGVENLTLACGTGAIASAVAHHYLQGLDTEKNIFKVDCKGGQLMISFDFVAPQQVYNNIHLTGPADFVFEGKLP